MSFLVPDVSSPSLGAPLRLALLLRQAGVAVQIVGPDLGHGVCGMYRGAFDYTVVPTPRLYRFPDFLWESRRLGAAITGDVVIAVKAFADTIPVALRERRRRGVRVVVYLDEWDGATYWQLAPKKRLACLWRNLHHPLETPYHPWVEKLIPRADLVLSSSTWLQKRFGGHVLPLGVDTDFFRPAASEQTAALKSQCRLAGARTIVFGGVVRPHKGIEIILDALVRLGRPDYRFVIVGPMNEHVAALQAHPAYRPYIAFLGEQSSVRMPEFLSLADLIVLPLKDTLLARSQMPCKVFEAMAMARPIIASAVSDLPAVLEGCGVVVPPGNPDALAAAIADLLQQPPKAQALGRAAREKCLRLYSQDITRRELKAMLEKMEAGMSGRTAA